MTLEQSRALTFITAYIDEHGFSPSYTEIGMHLGLASKSGVYRLIGALERLGKIRRISRSARSLEVVEPSRFGAPELAARLADALLKVGGLDDDEEGVVLVLDEKILRTILLAELTR